MPDVLDTPLPGAPVPLVLVVLLQLFCVQSSRLGSNSCTWVGGRTRLETHALPQPNAAPHSNVASPQPKRYSKRLPEELRTRLLRRSLWDALRSRLLPQLLGVCSQAVAASEADMPHKDEVMEALALGGPAGAPAMCANPACGSLRGAAEAPLLRLACPGCGVPHYCSAACLEANAGRHAPACGVLRSMHSREGEHAQQEASKPAALAAEDSAAEAAGQLARLDVGS